MQMSNFKRCVSTACIVVVLGGCARSQLPQTAQPQSASQHLPTGQRSYHILHPFGRSSKDGANPAADLIDIKGTLYGTTARGGSHGGGTVFSITTGGDETVLHSFGASNDGYAPISALLNVHGTLYGTTAGGGDERQGTVFSLTLSGDERVMHSFPTYEGNPAAGLINVGGTLYGVTGGLDGYYYCGEVFRITTAGTFTVLHGFNPGRQGCSPQGSLLDVDGTLYGTTARGGKDQDGTVFAITTSGTYRTLYSFGEGADDGRQPMSALINVQGTLYGTTYKGGANDDGTIFSITAGGAESVVHSFDGTDGSFPFAGLKNVKGVLYGTTQYGGTNNLGTIFKLTKSGALTVVHSFAKGEGINPRAGVIAVNGALYGATYGQTVGKVKRSFGNVYSLKPRKGAP